jgi:hypothetical protein
MALKAYNSVIGMLLLFRQGAFNNNYSYTCHKAYLSNLRH